MELSISARNGSRCQRERHRFRIGIDTDNSTEFSAAEDEFLSALENAIIEHGLAKRPGSSCLYLQVWTTPGAKWRNVQNPKTGGVMAVTPSIAGQEETASTLFAWACNSIQMARDCDVIADGLAR